MGGSYSSTGNNGNPSSVLLWTTRTTTKTLCFLFFKNPVRNFPSVITKFNLFHLKYKLFDRLWSASCYITLARNCWISASSSLILSSRFWTSACASCRAVNSSSNCNDHQHRNTHPPLSKPNSETFRRVLYRLNRITYTCLIY